MKPHVLCFYICKPPNIHCWIGCSQGENSLAVTYTIYFLFLEGKRVLSSAQEEDKRKKTVDKITAKGMLIVLKRKVTISEQATTEVNFTITWMKELKDKIRLRLRRRLADDSSTFGWYYFEW